MIISIKNEIGKAVDIRTDDKKIDKLNQAYPEVAMMMAMEECSELAIAISKCIRNGSDSKRENLAEEIVDVLSVIQWAIRRFNISDKMLSEWAKSKSERTNDRLSDDSAIFRSENAKTSYLRNRGLDHNLNNGLTVIRNENGKYIAKGDIKNALEYYHALNTYLYNKGLLNESLDDDLFDEPNESEDTSDVKLTKDASKSLEKLVQKAAKNAKKIDKVSDKKKKSDKKSKKDDKKKGKKDKK